MYYSQKVADIRSKFAGKMVPQRASFNEFLHGCLQAPNLLRVICSCNFSNDNQVLSEKFYCKEIYKIKVFFCLFHQICNAILK